MPKALATSALANGGAEGAHGGEVWGGDVPLPQKKNCIFSFEMVHFDAFWRTFRPSL